MPADYRIGDLVALPADAYRRVGMIVGAYSTLYGGAYVDVVFADADAGTDGEWYPLVVAESARYWEAPRSFAVSEIAPMAHSRKDR